MDSKKINPEKTLNIDKILADVRWNDQGLIPAITQDIETGEVLMLAYMNREALRKTLVEGKACYFSRSRKSLWVKGETSGNFQELVDLRFDCDRDTVLLLVKQTGMACHENYFSCFHYGLKAGAGWNEKNPEDEGSGEFVKIGQPETRPSLSLGRILELLAEVIKQRKVEKPEGSYTVYLFEKGLDKILKKVGEECAEVIIAAKNNSREEIRYETADLFYHLLVLLEEQGIRLEEIAQELESRRR